MNYDLVIATTTCFEQYGHVKDAQYRRERFNDYVRSFSETKWMQKKISLVVSNDSGDGWNNNYFRVLNQVTGMAPFCLIADSDAYFHPDWLRWLYDAMDMYPDCAGWSLYNSPRNTTVIHEIGNGNIERKHSQPHGLVYRTADRPISDPVGWFEDFIGELSAKHSMGFVTPKVSMIQHTGVYGLNNVPGGSQDYDPNFPLNKECGLGDWTDRTGFDIPVQGLSANGK